MLARKIYNVIEQHFVNKEQEIILVDGSRQVGKTYIIRKVGESLFKNFVEINMVNDSEGERLFGYWFGFLSSDDSDLPKFVFPEDTNEVLVKWFNNIYDDFSEEETKIVWENIQAHPEIQDISDQIWNELETLVENDEGWGIY